MNGGPDVRWAPVWDRIDEDFDEHLGEIRNAGLPGDPPDPVARPQGCSFHPRCPAAFDPCDRIDPVLERYGSRLAACHLVAMEEA